MGEGLSTGGLFSCSFQATAAVRGYLVAVERTLIAVTELELDLVAHRWSGWTRQHNNELAKGLCAINEDFYFFYLIFLDFHPCFYAASFSNLVLCIIVFIG